MKTSDILAKGKSIIMERWAENNRHHNLFIKKGDDFCWCSSHTPYIKAHSYLKTVAITLYLWQWNDSINRTKEEVINLFEQAIVLAENDGD